MIDATEQRYAKIEKSSFMFNKQEFSADNPIPTAIFPINTLLKPKQESNRSGFCLYL